MSTIAVISPAPIPTGPAAAIDQVQSTMELMKTQMDTYTGKLDSVLEQLIGVASDIDDGQFAEPDLDFPIGSPPLQSGGGLPDESLANTIDVVAPTAPTLTANLQPQPVFQMPAEPALDVLNIPPAPNPSVVPVPVRPLVSTDLVVPDAPVIALPVLEALTEIVIPTFVAPVLPTFDEVAPTWDAAEPNVTPNWVEPVYESENFDAALATIQRFRLGGTGLPEWVEQMLFERNRGREDRATDKAVAEIYDTYAARGFDAPPGVLAKDLAAVREASQFAISSFSRDVYLKATDIEVENLRLSVTQGLAAEQVLLSIFNNAATRAFEMARFTVESLIALYNTKVSIFNALMQGFQTSAAVKKMKLEAALATLEVYRLQLDGEKLKGEINEQRVRTLVALTQAALSQVEIYKGELAGVHEKAEIVKAIFDAYKTDVSAYAETINADKLRFDAHKSVIEGEVAKGQLNATKANIFQSLVQAQETIGRTWAQGAQVEISRMDSAARAFGSEIEGFRATTQAQLGRVQAVVSLKNARTSAVEARDRAVIAGNEAAIRIGQQHQDGNVAKAQLGVKLYEVNITKLNQVKEIQTKALAAAGQMLSTLAGGAMAAQHVSASISSSASDGYSVSKSESISNSLSEKV